MNLHNKPLDLSVVIPAFNAAATIEETILSARKAGANEIIVVDDGSTDSTAAIAASLNCFVITQENAGAAAARRRGIVAATSSRIILLDSDDSVLASGVLESISMLDANPSMVLVQGVTIGIGLRGSEKRLRPWPENVTTASLLHRGHASGPPAAFVWKASALKDVIGPKPKGVWPRYAEDYEFLLRGSLLGEIGQHSVDSCRYRWTGGKSGGAPKSSVGDAERIRRHYARLTEIPIERRTPRQLMSMVWMRRASALTSTRDAPRRAVYTALALLNDPRKLTNKFVSLMARPNSGDEPSVGGQLRALSLQNTLRADWAANPRDPKARLVLTGFRLCQFAMGDLTTPRRLSIPFVIAYRLMTEFGLGIELRPKTKVGPGLSIFHGTGLVVNDHAVIGSRVVLRNGVTIGHQRAGGGSPSIGDDVVVGANALVLGDISIGKGAIIGAGSVVVKSVPEYATVVGNPARVISSKPSF